MTEQRTKSTTQFVVDLGTLELPPVVTRQIESEIRTVVLKALADLDTEPAPARRLDPALFGEFTGRTLGLWLDPEHPEDGSWEDTVPRAGKNGPAPFVTRNEAVFRARLASTKATGAEAIRVSRRKGDLCLDQLDGRGRAIAGFVLHPIIDSTKKVNSVEITRVGARGEMQSGGKPAPLGAADRAALAVIVDELAQIKEEQPSPPGVVYKGFWRGLLEAVDAGIACGLAGVEGGLNPIADAGCAVAAGLMLDDSDDDD